MDITGGPQNNLGLIVHFIRRDPGRPELSGLAAAKQYADELIAATNLPRFGNEILRALASLGCTTIDGTWSDFDGVIALAEELVEK